MPEELEGGGSGGAVIGGGGVTGEPIGEEEASGDAVQDDLTSATCEERVEALEAENEALRGQVSELESALGAMEHRFELERALTDAGVVDLETALAVVEVEPGGDAATAVSELIRAKPFLFRATSSRPVGSAVSGGAARDSGSLSGLAEEARRSGDRRALTRYLRKRRGA